MAKLVVKRSRLVLRLNAIERLLDLRFKSPSVPAESVESVALVDDPRDLLATDIDFGFAGNTAPGRGAMTAFSRGKFKGGRAAVFVYFRGQSIRTDIADGGRWKMFLVSSRSAVNDLAVLKQALATLS